MGECFLVQKGSSIVSDTQFAIIAVTYPEGSTCTCTNGATTFTDSNTNGQVVFNIPSTGTWTVSCTDLTNTAKTKSKSVSITAEGQYEEVKLSYQLVLIAPNTAAIADGYTLENLSIMTDGTYGSYITFKDGSTAGESGYISPTIDLTNYNTLRVKFCLTGDAYNSASYGTVGVYKTLPSYSAIDPVAGFSAGQGVGQGYEYWGLKNATEITIDISALSGEYYFSGFSNGWGATIFYAIFE